MSSAKLQIETRADGPDGPRPLRDWRQGDVVATLEKLSVTPLTGSIWASTKSAVGRLIARFGRNPSAESLWVVITQTCDLVRPAAERGWVQLSPVVRLGGHALSMARKLRDPRYAAVPQAGDDAFADLDRVLTLDKPLATTFRTVESLPSLPDVKRFSATIGRHYGRPALPDALAESLRKLRDRIVEKHGKHSPEGSALEALHEIRVRAQPDWAATDVTVLLYFIVPDETKTGIDGTTLLDGPAWEKWVRNWGAMFDPKGNLKECVALPITYLELDALSYRSSEPLDIEYTSLA